MDELLDLTPLFAQREHLKAENERLRAALQPFADYADTLAKDRGGPFPDTAKVRYAPLTYAGCQSPTVGDCRAAKIALEQEVTKTEG